MNSGTELIPMGTGITLWINNYDYMKYLYLNGQFLGTKNGQNIVMDKSFLGTARMDAVRGPMRTSFNNTYKGLSYLKWGGNVFGVLTTGFSSYEFVKSPNWVDGSNTGFGIAAIIYAPIGIYYGLGSLLFWGQMNTFKYMGEDYNPGAFAPILMK